MLDKNWQSPNGFDKNYQSPFMSLSSFNNGYWMRRETKCTPEAFLLVVIRPLFLLYTVLFSRNFKRISVPCFSCIAFYFLGIWGFPAANVTLCQRPFYRSISYECAVDFWFPDIFFPLQPVCFAVMYMVMFESNWLCSPKVIHMVRSIYTINRCVFSPLIE